MAWGPFNAGSGGAQSGGGTAKEIAYEDTLGISASNIQEALDKVLGNTLPKLTVTTTGGSALTITDGPEHYHRHGDWWAASPPRCPAGRVDGHGITGRV